MSLPSTPPQDCLAVKPFAEPVRALEEASISPTKLESADHNKAATPATWGPAIEVPLNEEQPPPGTAERTNTPGAAISGPISPSNVEGPRLEKKATLELGELTAPTENVEELLCAGPS